MTRRRAGPAGQQLVEGQLHAFLPLVLDAVEADHVRGHVALGVIAQRLGLLVHAGQVELLILSATSIGTWRFEVDEVLCPSSARLAAQVGRRHVEQAGQRVLICAGVACFTSSGIAQMARAGTLEAAVPRRCGRGSCRAWPYRVSACFRRRRSPCCCRNSPDCSAGNSARLASTVEPAEQQDQHQPSLCHMGSCAAQHGVVEEKGSRFIARLPGPPAPGSGRSCGRARWGSS